MAGDAMNEHRLRPLSVLAILFALLLGACSADPGTPPLQGASLGGPFTLTDQHGRRVSDTDFDGRYRLVYFGFTYCPDVCPTHLADLMLARDLLGDAGVAVQPIFIPVDPDRDTAEQVRSYIGAFGSDLTGLTGNPVQIARATEAFGVYYRKVDPDRPGGYIMDHSALGYLLGRAAVDKPAARTVSIEVGMQNSGLGVVLARSNFADPLVAVPCALSSIVHSLIGSALAAVWSKSPVAAGQTPSIGKIP
jgi:protein SCO1